MPTEYEHELFRLQVLEHSRWREALNWLKQQLWRISESGPFGWLGDRCDDFEHALLRRRARINLRRRGAPEPPAPEDET